MYQEIDKIYELCKKVISEAPTALVSFDFGNKCLTLYGLKNKKDLHKPENEFKWDFHENIWWKDTEEGVHVKYKKMRAFLLELLIDGRCPLNAESGGIEAPADNGADNDSERASGGAEQAESVHS